MEESGREPDSAALRRWSRIAAASTGLLGAYLLLVLLLEEPLCGVQVRTRYLVLLLVAGIACLYRLLRWSSRRRWISTAHLKSLALGSAVSLGSVVCLDVAFTVYLESHTALGVQEFLLQDAFRVTDPRPWFAELLPPKYYPTDENFFLHKPNVASSGDVYGWFYYPALLQSPTLVDSVLERRHVSYVIDENGFRETTPLERARVFALGDSFTFGTGVDQEETWVELLERALGEPVYNLGMNGTSPRQQLMLLQFLLETRGDSMQIRNLLWMIFEGNDLEDSYDPSNRIQIERASSSILRTIPAALRSIALGIKDQAVLHRLLTDQVILGSPFTGNGAPRHDVVDGVRLTRNLYRSSRHGYRLFLPAYTERAAQPESYLREHPNRPLLDQTFRDMASLREKYGFEVTVLIAPTAARLYAAEFEDFPSISEQPHFIDYVGRLAREQGFGVVDLYRLMQPYTGTELLYWRDDSHWNRRGNALVAELVAKHARTQPEGRDSIRP